MTGQGTETGRNALAGLPAVQSRRLHRNRLYRRGERTFSSLGRRKSSTLQDSSTWNYTYNQRSEITSAIRKNASNVTQNTMRYGFDSIGNRTSSYENPTSKTYSANSLNQYTGIDVAGGNSISPQYDDDGNMTGYGSWTYTWDAENRLVKAVNGTTRLEFIYDALSRRVAKKLYQGNTLSKHERYVYDGMKLLASYNAKSSFAKINTFLWQPFGADVPLIMTYGSTIYGYLVDANKNVLGLFNPSQSRVATYLYGPFGQIISSSGTIAANNPIRFSSEQFDADLGLVYYNYRYYSPELGRWLSKDPIGEKGGWNLYLMCRNNVVNVWDERGQIADWVVWIVAGAIILTMNGCTKPEKKTTPQEDGKENCTIHIFMGHGRLFDKNDPQNSEVDPNSMIGNYAQQFAGDEPNPFAGVAIVGCWAKETMIAVDKKREQEKKKPINWIYSASSNIPNIREINRRGEDRLTPRGIENVFYIPRTKGELEKEVLDAAEEYAKRICNTKNNCCKEIRIVLTNATDFEWFSELPKVIPCKK